MNEDELLANLNDNVMPVYGDDAQSRHTHVSCLQSQDGGFFSQRGTVISDARVTFTERDIQRQSTHDDGAGHSFVNLQASGKDFFENPIVELSSSPR